MRPFHYSFTVRDLDETRRFYLEKLGCKEGRSATHWVDFDFLGNQLSAHLGDVARAAATGLVDGIRVPMPHFGAIVGWDEFEALKQRLAGIEFIITPRVRFAGQPGEQATMFFLDPSGNAIEIKAFRRDAEIFSR